MTWQDPYLFVQKPRGTVLHLHGHRDWPDSIVLGAMDYAGVASDRAAQEMQRALSVTKTMLLVGFGAGLDDPNFEALRTWMREVWGEAGFRHYRLCLKSELPALDEQHDDEQIYPLPYGTSHQQLAPHLNALAAEAELRRRKQPWFEGARSRVRRKAGAAAAWLVRVRGRVRTMPRLALLASVAGLLGLVGLVGLVLWAFRSTRAQPRALPDPAGAGRAHHPDQGGERPTARGRVRRPGAGAVPAVERHRVLGALLQRRGRRRRGRLAGRRPVAGPPAGGLAARRHGRGRTGQPPARHGPAALGSIATSPVVLAVPESAMATVGQARTVTWETMVERAQSAAPGSRLRIGRPDPTSSTAGLLATIGLHEGSGRPATPDSRHAVEQAIDPVADELIELCQLGQPGGPARAVIVSEQAMVAYNRDARLGGACDARSRGSER